MNQILFSGMLNEREKDINKRTDSKEPNNKGIKSIFNNAKKLKKDKTTEKNKKKEKTKKQDKKQNIKNSTAGIVKPNNISQYQYNNNIYGINPIQQRNNNQNNNNNIYRLQNKNTLQQRNINQYNNNIYGLQNKNTLQQRNINQYNNNIYGLQNRNTLQQKNINLNNNHNIYRVQADNNKQQPNMPNTNIYRIQNKQQQANLNPYKAYSNYRNEKYEKAISTNNMENAKKQINNVIQRIQNLHKEPEEIKPEINEPDEINENEIERAIKQRFESSVDVIKGELEDIKLTTQLDELVRTKEEIIKQKKRAKKIAKSKKHQEDDSKRYSTTLLQRERSKKYKIGE